MNKTKENRYISVLWFLIAELIVSAAVIGIFAIVIFLFPDALFYNTAFYKVILGSVLGTAATVFNFFALCFTVNRAVDKYMTQRGDAEMDEEEARAFVNANAAKVQTEVTKSYLLRTRILVLACALLFTKQFDVIAVVVPMLVQRPLIAVIEKIKGGKS